MKKVAPRMLKEAKSSKNATLLAQFGTEYSWVLDGCMKSKIVNSVVQYADYKFAVTMHFEEKAAPEIGDTYAWFYQTNIFSKVYRRGNYEITKWKFKDVTDYS